MLELTFVSIFTILPDYLVRRYLQGKRWGQELNFFSVWYELRWGLTGCAILTVTTTAALQPSVVVPESSPEPEGPNEPEASEETSQAKGDKPEAGPG